MYLLMFENSVFDKSHKNANMIGNLRFMPDVTRSLMISVQMIATPDIGVKHWLILTDFCAYR